ncbi:MAG: FAD-dependent oxidoreductase [Erysipelotrichaceae bacterium]|nr:FAD-dependent oxidoreductase [Erysipelotrichaceae bacterium]
MSKYEHVFSPFTIRGKRFKNRIEFSPFVCNKATIDGECGSGMIDFIEMQAKTGVSYITIGDTQIDYSHGNNFAGEIRVDDDKYIGGLYSIAEAAHKNDAYLSIELSHCGAGANPDINVGQALSPSGVALGAPFTSTNPKAMTREDMDFVRDKWVECCKRCVSAGFDMVMIHSAHQALLGQFLSPLTNTRTDEYGGSLENRMRYPLEVIKAIREGVGENVVIEMRVSGREEVEGGLEEDEALEYLKAAQKYIDIVNVSRGSIYDPVGSTYTMPNYMKPARFNVSIAEKFKKNLDIMVAVAGNIYTVADAEEIIANGQADIVSMAHNLLADPEMIHNALANEEYKTRPCIRCQECAEHIGCGRPIRCTVNPSLGFETEMKYLQPAKESKKVVIVGGGPAAMQAAQTCMKRGHKVVLFEKNDKLGGLLHDAGAVSSKSLLRQYTDWDIRMTMESGADIRLNTEATIEMIQAENPDAIIVATGSRYVHPPIPGIDGKNVYTVSDVDNKRVKLGKRVVVCGSSATGIECAEELGSEGHEVTIIDMISKEAMTRTINRASQQEIIMMRFPKYGVKMEGNCKIKAFGENEVICDTPDGEKRFEMDSAVIALGVAPYNPLTDELLKLYPLKTYVIGDCKAKGGTIKKANLEAFNVAINL